MLGVRTLYSTSIGKKVVMAITGFVLYAYVIVHMLANLKIFGGLSGGINEYAVFLREVGVPIFAAEQVLWLARLVLLAAVGLHIVAAVQVTQQDIASRPVGYARKNPVVSTFAGRTMRWGGIFIFLFIIFHILHFTTGTFLAGYRELEPYHNVTSGFANPLVALFYIAAMVALGLHLYHGIWSMSQTLGWRTRANDGFWRGLASLSALVIAGGFIVVPLGVLLGIVRP